MSGKSGQIRYELICGLVTVVTALALAVTAIVMIIEAIRD